MAAQLPGFKQCEKDGIFYPLSFREGCPLCAAKAELAELIEQMDGTIDEIVDELETISETEVPEDNFDNYESDDAEIDAADDAVEESDEEIPDDAA
jgi:hypothetical protein